MTASSATTRTPPKRKALLCDLPDFCRIPAGLDVPPRIFRRCRPAQEPTAASALLLGCFKRFRDEPGGPSCNANQASQPDPRQRYCDHRCHKRRKYYTVFSQFVQREQLSLLLRVCSEFLGTFGCQILQAPQTLRKYPLVCTEDMPD